MLWFYLVASAALVPISDIFFDVLRESYSWWFVPVLYIGFLLAFILIHVVFVVTAIALINPNSPPERFSRFYRTLVDLSLPMVFTFARIKVEITGKEKVPQDTRFLLVSNHLHDLDPAIILYSLPEAELGFVGKKEIYTQMPFVSRAMHKLNCLPIDRENNREAVKTIISAAKLISEDKASMVIFPEGYCSKDGDLQPLRNGALKIAYKAKVPIVVCTLDHTKQLPKNIFRRKTVIHFDILDVVTARELETVNSTEIGDRIFDTMQKNILRRRQEENAESK